MSAAGSVPPRAERARAAVARRLEGAQGLVGVGIGSDAGGRKEILVLVTERGCEAERLAPREEGGCCVRVEVSGPPRRQ